MKINNLESILSLYSADFKVISGAVSSSIQVVSTPKNIKSGSLVFISTAEQWQHCLLGNPSLVIALESLLKDSIFVNEVPKSMCLVSSGNIKRAMSLVLPFFEKSPRRTISGIHPTTALAGDISIGKNVSIGAFSSVGKNVKIGDDTWIGPNVIIEDGVTIGSQSVVHGHVFVGYECNIGDNTQIHAHTSIGSDGFGFYTDHKYQHYKVPQIGNVVIGDFVEIGAGCCVDRGTIDSTTIGNGTKIDNLCHIAHNCAVGENSMIAAGFFVAGSSTLGNRFTAGGNTVVSTQLRISDDVMVAGRSTVTNHITEPGQYGGYPLQPLKDALKTISTLGTIVEMRKKINLVLKTLSLKD